LEVDTDIDSLDHASAREYVLSFLTALKRSEKERAIAEEELAHWERRVKMADSRGEPQLKKLAAARAAELREQASRLRGEEQTLRRKMAVLRQKLAVLRERASFAVDADALLAQLRQLAGEPDPLARELEEQEARAALEELKRKQG
jgi:phage shock protein A